MKTEADLLAIMDAEQQKHPALAGVKSSSQTSLLTYLKRMWASLWQLLARDVEQSLLDIQTASAQYQIGTLDWYVTQAKLFQYGQPTTIIDGRVGYRVIDPAARIIAQAAVVEDAANRRLLLKANRRTGSVLMPLTTEELSALRAYMQQVKWAGTALDVVSLAADEVRLQVRVRLDPKVLAASGASLLDPTLRPVPAAVQLYLQNLPFNGELTWQGLTDALQTVPGIVTFDVLRSWARDAGGTAWTEFQGSYATRAGHMTLIAAESIFTYL